MTEVFRAKWLVPVTGDPVEDGAIAVEHGRIVQVGKADTIGAAAARDLGDCILLPGFVNAHTHLELSCYRGMVPATEPGCVSPVRLWEWFERLMALRLRPGTVDREREAVRAGAAASLAAGVTCLGDISRTGIHIEGLRDSPIRKVCFLELISGASQPPNDPRSLAAAVERARDFAEPTRLIVGISPHTLYTVTWDDLVATAALADEHDVPVTIHLLETAEEAQWLPTGGGPLQAFLARYALPTASGGVRGRAMDLLQRAGLTARRALLAHANYVDDDDLRNLATSRAIVVWCPRSHRFFGHPPHRWRDMLAARVGVCVGTDSLASNHTLSILDELRYLHRTAPDVSPGTILEMGTLRGAIGLGLDRTLGSLEIGKCADFVTVPWEPTAPDEPLLNLLEGTGEVSGVWIGGVDVLPPQRHLPPGAVDRPEADG